MQCITLMAEEAPWANSSHPAALKPVQVAAMRNANPSRAPSHQVCSCRAAMRKMKQQTCPPLLSAYSCELRG